MIGFAGGIPGVVGALCGILACVASSILMCCAPKSTEEGGCKFTAVRDGSMHSTATKYNSQTPQLACCHNVTFAPHNTLRSLCLHSPSAHITYAFLPPSLTHAYISQAGVLLLIAGVVQLIMCIIVIVQLIIVLNEVTRENVACLYSADIGSKAFCICRV